MTTTSNKPSGIGHIHEQILHTSKRIATVYGLLTDRITELSTLLDTTITKQVELEQRIQSMEQELNEYRAARTSST